MRRILIALALVVVIAAGLVLLVPRLVSNDTVQREVARLATQLTGYDVQINGDTRFRFWPHVGFAIRDVSLSAMGGRGQPAAVMDELRGSVDILSLLGGTIAVQSFTLVRPKIAFIIDENGNNNWDSMAVGGVETAVAERKAEQEKKSSLKIGTIRVEEGSVHIDAGNGSPLDFTGVDFAVTWPTTDSALRTDGQFIWNGITINTDLRVSDPLGLASGGTSELRAAFTSSLGSLSVDGEANLKSEFQFTGSSALDSEDMRGLLKWAGATVAPGSGLNRLALSGDMNLVGKSAAISNVRLSIDDQLAEGAIKLASSENGPVIQGTLALGVVDVSPYLNSPEADNRQSVDGQPVDQLESRFDLSPLHPYDIDLRISAAGIKANEIALGRVAASLTARDGKVQVALGEANLFGGQATGSLTGSTIAGSELPIMASVQTKGLQAAPLLAALGYPEQLDGLINATLNLDGNGVNLERFKQSMSGQGKLDITNATLSGFDLRRALQLIFNPVVNSETSNSGQTAFSLISGTFDVNSGIATTNDLILNGNNLQISVAGQHNVPTGAMNGRGLAELVVSRDGEQKTTKVPFLIGGTLEAPVLAPDPKWLLQIVDGDEKPLDGNALGGLIQNGLQNLLQRGQNQ